MEKYLKKGKLFRTKFANTIFVFLNGPKKGQQIDIPQNTILLFLKDGPWTLSCDHKFYPHFPQYFLYGQTTIYYRRKSEQNLREIFEEAK